ncbi:MAG TPA: histidine kinase [Bacteroidia bacterium]|nr:histidine kinase [Bacteroidia bacterium]
MFRFCKYLLFYFLPFWAFSQTPSFNFQKLGSEEGLNNANIFHIEQHSNGLMYFTTQNGVYRYDGYRFEQVLIDSLKSNTLLNASIRNEESIYLSVRGEGIAEYNLKDRSFHFPKALRFSNNADRIVFDRDWLYLLTSGIKLQSIHLSDARLVQDEVKTKDHMNQAYCIYRTRSGQLLLGRSDGLYELSEGRQKKLDIKLHSGVYAMAESLSDELLLGCSGKIVVLKNMNFVSQINPEYPDKSTTFSMSGDQSIDKLICDEFGRIWFTSFPDENLYLYQNGKVYDMFGILGIAPTLINSVYRDTDNNIWVGTFNDGLYFIQNSIFNSVQFLYKNKNLSVNQVFLKDNLLVAATNNGLFGLNTTNNQTRVLSEPDDVFMEPVSGLVQVNGVIYYAKRSHFNSKPSLFFDSKNSYRLQPVVARQFYPLNQAQSIVADWNANILLCDAGGNRCLDTLISFPDYRIAVNALYTLNKSLYIATSNGLYKYDFESKRHSNLVRDALNFNINDIVMVNGKLMVAHEAGITDVTDNRLITKLGNFQLNSVKKIKVYGDAIWLATLDGVLICNRNFEPIQIINKSNGLLSNSVNDICLSEEILSIATARGISMTRLINIARINRGIKPVSIHKVLCQGLEIPFKTGSYQLNASQDNISVQFYSPLFVKPNRQFFRYKLDDENWREFNDLSLNISLSGGQHRIEIKVSADNINWSEPTSISIVKEKKISEAQSLYFVLTIASLLLLGLISFIWVRRVKHLAKKRLKQEQQINELKHQAMNSLLSPHFIFNSLTSIQNYINSNDSLKASEYLAKFSRLIRMIIEKAAQREISLYDELARLTYYLELEKERFKNKFEYAIHIDGNIDTTKVMIPNMIIQPHVENSILHGILPKHAPGRLDIYFSMPDEKHLLITIEDDGIGLNKSQDKVKTGHKSLGTLTIRNILDINSRLSGKKQELDMIDRSDIDPSLNGTRIQITIEL